MDLRSDSNLIGNYNRSNRDHLYNVGRIRRKRCHNILNNNAQILGTVFSCGLYGFSDYKKIPKMLSQTWFQMINKYD